MEQVQFYGKPPSSAKTISGTPGITLEEKQQKDLDNVQLLYRDGIVKAMRSGIKLFQPIGKYANLPPQQRALERLLEAIPDNELYKLESITNGSYKESEFLLKLSLSIRRSGVNHRVEVLVGLCDKFNELVNTPYTPVCEIYPPGIYTCADVCKQLLSNLCATEAYHCTGELGNFYISPEGYYYEFRITH